MEYGFQRFKSLSIFFLFLIGLAFSASMVGALSHPDPTLERTSNSGGVRIAAQYNPPQQDQSDMTSFSLTLSTHYVDLKQYDIKNLAFVRVDEEMVQPATKWVASGDNHHIHGTLSFPNQKLEGSQLVRLIIKNIGDTSDRIFEWNAPVTKQ
jgi:hypothetical protein